MRACVRAACASVRLCVRRACACAPTSDIAIGRNGGHELLRLRADFVARHAHAHWLVVAVLEEHDPVLLLAALAADDTPAVPAVVPPLQHIKVFAAGRARLGALVGLPFWPPVALRGLRHGALQRGGPRHRLPGASSCRMPADAGRGRPHPAVRSGGPLMQWARAASPPPARGAAPQCASAQPRGPPSCACAWLRSRQQAGCARGPGGEC